MELNRIINILMSLLTALIAMCGNAFAEDSFRKALIFTYLNSPDLLMERKFLEGNNEELIQAQSSLYPSANLSMTSQRSYSSINSDFDTQTDTNTLLLSGEYTLYSSGAITSGIKASEELVRTARYSLQYKEQQVLLAAIKAYLDVIRDRKLVDISINNVKVIREQVEATKNRFALGSATRTDLAEREAAYESAKAELSMREGVLTASEQIYETQIGIKAEPILFDPVSIPEFSEDANVAKRIGLLEHPLILAANSQVRQSKNRLQQTIAAQGVNIKISGSIQHLNGQSTDNNTGNISLSASIPLYRGGSLTSRERQRALDVDNAKSSLKKQIREVEQNIEISWKNLKVSEATVEARLLQVSASVLAYDGIKKEYDLGARSNLELNLAEQNLLKARSDLTSSERDVAYAVFSLFASMGKLDVDLLQLQVTPFDPEASGLILSPVSNSNVIDGPAENPLKGIWSNLKSVLNN